MSTGGGTRAIIAALAANAGIAIAKFIGFVITGSSSMLAEAVHSLADTANQGLLLLGGKRAKRAATPEHPFGYGRDRFFYAFVVALLLFTLGSVFALYEGIEKLGHPGELTSPGVAIGILLVAIGLEGFSFRTAIHESRGLKGAADLVAVHPPGHHAGAAGRAAGGFRRAHRAGARAAGRGAHAAHRQPGVRRAGHDRHRHPAWRHRDRAHRRDEEPAHRRGRAPAGARGDRRRVCEGGAVQSVIHLRTQYLGPEELLVAAKIALTPGLLVEDVARAIDDAEARVRAAVPAARLIYLEPDLERTVRR